MFVHWFSLFWSSVSRTTCQYDKFSHNEKTSGTKLSVAMRRLSSSQVQSNSPIFRACLRSTPGIISGTDWNVVERGERWREDCRVFGQHQLSDFPADLSKQKLKSFVDVLQCFVRYWCHSHHYSKCGIQYLHPLNCRKIFGVFVVVVFFFVLILHNYGNISISTVLLIIGLK